MFVPRFALGTVALLALFASVRGQSQCSSDQRGDTSAYPVELPPVEIPPGVDFDIYVPTSPCPSGTKHVGTKLVGCDNDVPPTVKLDSLSHGTFHRNGVRNQTGVAYVTVYCRAGARAQAEQASAAAGNRQAQVSVARVWQ